MSQRGYKREMRTAWAWARVPNFQLPVPIRSAPSTRFRLRPPRRRELRGRGGTSRPASAPLWLAVRQGPHLDPQRHIITDCCLYGAGIGNWNLGPENCWKDAFRSVRNETSPIRTASIIRTRKIKFNYLEIS